MGQKIKVSVTRSPGRTEIYVKAPFLETYFSELSMKQFNKAKPVLGKLYVDSGDIENEWDEDASMTPRARTREIPAGERVCLYEYYKLKNLPEAAYGLKAGTDFVNCHGFLRAKGIGKGLRIRMKYPMTHNMAEQLAARVLENIKFLYIKHQERFTVTGEIDLGKDV
jgi:hypothetical protein